MAKHLQIVPHKLIFQFELGRQSSATITLQNPTDERIAFKVKTTAPLKYSVRPATGIVEAQGNARLVVMMGAPRSPLRQEVKDRFLVEALAVGPDVAAPTSELFKANPGSVSSTKLKVAWLDPSDGDGAEPAAAASASEAAGEARTTPTAGHPAAASTASASRQHRQQHQQREKSPGVPAAASPHVHAPPGPDALAGLPEDTSLPRDAPAATVAPAGAVEPAGAGKFSASLRKQMTKLQQKQQAQQRLGSASQTAPAQLGKASCGSPGLGQEREQHELKDADQPQPAVAQPEGPDAPPPAHPALASHHAELAPAVTAAEGTAGSSQPCACDAAPAAAPAPVHAARPSAARRLPTRGARTGGVPKARQRQKQPDLRQKQQQDEEEEEMQDQQRQQQQPPGGKEELPSGEITCAVPAGPACVDAASELAAETDDSDPDFALDEDLLDAEDMAEQRWMTEQRRLWGLPASGGGSDGGGAAAPAGRRRRSTAAAAAAAGGAAPAVAVKEEQQEERRRTVYPQRQAEVVELLSDSDCDAENVEPPARGAARPATAAPRPRTKAVCPTSALSTLRLTFASAHGGDTLAEVLVRGCTPLRSVAAALAARCLEGGGDADAVAHLQLSLEGSGAPLEQGLAVKAARLQDGARILVALPGASS